MNAVVKNAIAVSDDIDSDIRTLADAQAISFKAQAESLIARYTEVFQEISGEVDSLEYEIRKLKERNVNQEKTLKTLLDTPAHLSTEGLDYVILLEDVIERLQKDYSQIEYILNAIKPLAEAQMQIQIAGPVVRCMYCGKELVGEDRLIHWATCSAHPASKVVEALKGISELPWSDKLYITVEGDDRVAVAKLIQAAFNRADNVLKETFSDWTRPIPESEPEPESAPTAPAFKPPLGIRRMSEVEDAPCDCDVCRAARMDPTAPVLGYLMAPPQIPRLPQ